MNVAADELKPALAAQNEMDGPIFKIASNPSSPAWAVFCADTASTSCPSFGMPCAGK